MQFVNLKLKGSVKIMKRKILPVQFSVLTLAGIWRPPNWSSLWIKISYSLYSFSVNLLIYTLGLSQMANIIFVKHTFSEFNDTFFVMLSTNFTCVKAACNLLIRKRVINLISLFEEDCCQARDTVEKDIQRRYDDICRSVYLINFQSEICITH